MIPAHGAARGEREARAARTATARAAREARGRQAAKEDVTDEAPARATKSAAIMAKAAILLAGSRCAAIGSLGIAVTVRGADTYTSDSSVVRPTRLPSRRLICKTSCHYMIESSS